jgi:hypothetical protein
MANFQTNGSDITSTILVYNLTANTGSITNHGGNNITVEETITLPLVASDTNLSFFWNITQENLATISLAEQNQTVLNLGIDNCSINNDTLYNFTMVDEETQTIINATAQDTLGQVDIEIYGFGLSTLIADFSTSYSQTNPFAICLSNNLSSGENHNVYVQVQYGGTGYETELYHIQNETINTSSFPTEITLYDLNSSDSQEFELIFVSSSFLPVEDALIEISRKYVDDGLFNIVEIPQTDRLGETVGHLVLNEVIYNFRIIRFGEVLASFNDVLAVCQTPLVTPCVIDFNAFAEVIDVPDFEETEDFLFTLGFNSTSRVISSVFSIPSGTSSTVLINVTTEDALGTSVCVDSLTSTSGTLNCNVGNSIGNSTVLAKIYRDGTLQAQGQVKLDQTPIGIYGGVLVILGLFIMMTLIGAGISDNPVYTVMFLMVGVILLFAINLIGNNGFIGATATILWLIVAIILIIIKGGRRS